MLAGRRLFLGDTDFATVKLVQQAVVPSISKVNPKVAADLERIVNKALARDPAQRYQTAREVAISLNDFLYRHGKPVGSFKIATLVQSTVRDKQRARPMQPSIIDKLIEEALFEFTSLQEASTVGEGLPPEQPVDVGASPLSLDRFQARDWTREIAIQESKSGGLAPQSVQAGNLAALEEGDDEPVQFLTAGDTADSDAPMATDPPPPIPLAHADSSLPPPRAPKKGSSSAVAFVVVLVLLVVTAGAYYTGLLPGVPPPH